MTKWFSLLATTSLVACGTEPTPEITGSWSLTASYAGGTLSCTLQATLHLDGNGASIPGSLIENAASCTDAGRPIDLVPQSHTLVATLNGRSISLLPQPPPEARGCALFRYEGTLSSETMSGTVATEPDFCQGTYVQMNGSWHAERSP